MFIIIIVRLKHLFLNVFLTLTKRIFFLLFITIAIIAAVMGYSQLKNSKKPKIDALSILPDNCLIYLSTNNFTELNTKINFQSLIIDKLKAQEDISTIVTTLQTLDSIITNHPLLKDELENATIHLAIYNQNKEWLSALNIKQLGSEALVLSQLVKLFNTKKTEANYYEFKLNTISNFVFTLKEGILIISNSSQLIADALSTNLPKLINNINFSTYKNNLQENNSFSIYVNHSAFQQNKIKTNLNLNALTTIGLSVGKIDIEPNEVKINGLLTVDSTNIFFNLHNQHAQAINYIEDLPFTTVEFSSYGFTSYSQLIKINKLNSFWQQVNDSALFNVQNDFYQNINHQIVNFKLKFATENTCLIPITDSIKTFEQLSFMCDSAKIISNSTIYTLKKNKKKLQLFYPFFNTETNYVAFYHSCLYFSTTKEALLSIINNLKFTNLSFNTNFVTYKSQQLSEEYNYVYYTALNNNKAAVTSFFPIDLKYCSNLQHFCYTLCNESANFKFRCNLLYETEQTNSEQNALWALLLDTTAQQQPYAFTNHLTNETEIVIQDDANNLHLISAKGNKLWTKKINEAIQSKIYTVDIFKNNKLQLLFNTKNYLHLMDRNGKYVQGYPVKLPSQATAPLSLLDYDNDKNYRLFISCKNKSIYNYTLYGIKQQGFTTIVTDNEVELPIQYVKVGLSDYLVAIDKMGKIYTYSRKGEERIGLKNKTIENCSAFYVDASNTIHSTFLVYVDDKNNLINKISFADKKEIKKLNNQITDASVSFNLIDDNRTMDILITSPRQLLSYDFNGNLIFEKNNDKQLSKSIYYSDEINSITLSFSQTLKQLFLNDINSQNTKAITANAFPLISNLFNSTKKYIIYCNGKQINCMAL